MVWLLLIVTGALAVMVGVLLLRVRRLERQVASALSSRDGKVLSSGFPESHFPSLDENRPATEYVITHVGEPQPAPAVGAPAFADMVLKETVVQTASLFQGLRRALAPETRNRIRFHMRQEVKRSRKQRRAELREVRREWAARQRRAQDTTQGTAA